MGDYRFTNTQACVYADRALTVEPGDVVAWDEPPADGHWEPADAAPPKPKSSKTASAPAASNSEE